MRGLFLALFLLILAVLALGKYQTYALVAEIEAEFPAHGQFAETSGAKIHFVDLGPKDAPPQRTLVLLHGASANLRDMQASIGETLAREFRVILVDRPGHGWSARISGREDASLERQARIIFAMLKSIGIERAVFLGHSWAGGLVLNMALEAPSFVEAVVLLAPVSHPWPGGISWYYNLATLPVLGDLLVATIMAPAANAVFQSALDSAFAPSLPPKTYLEQTGAKLGLRPREFKANAEDVEGLLRQIRAQAPRYRDLNLPILIMTGEVDSIVSPKIHSENLTRDVKGTRLVVLNGAGHAPHHSRKVEVLAEISEFMKTLPMRR